MGQTEVSTSIASWWNNYLPRFLMWCGALAYRVIVTFITSMAMVLIIAIVTFLFLNGLFMWLSLARVL